MRITPLEVLEQTFRLTFRGFDPAEVDAYLQRVADELQRLIEERDRMVIEVEEAKAARTTLEQALASAKELQEGILVRARQEAEAMRAEGRRQGDRIVDDARDEAARLRDEVAEIRTRRDLLLSQVGALGTTLSTWARDQRLADVEPLDLGPDLMVDDPLPDPETTCDRVDS